MPFDQFQILLVGADCDDAKAAMEMLSQSDGPSFVVQYADSLLEALDRLAQQRVDAILLDIMLADSRGLETFAKVRAHAPGIPVVIWSDVENQQLARSAVQAGAQDYLIKGRLNGAALQRALHYAIMRTGSTPSAGPPRPESTVVGVLGAKGGVGTTTVACHLGADLRRLSSQSILLADLDLFAGQVAFMMNSRSRYSILDAASNVHRMDKDFSGGVIAEGAGGVSIIQSPGLTGSQELPPTHRIRQVFRFLRSCYPWIVIDLARINHLSLAFINDVDELLLVATTEVQALLEAKRIAASLPDLGCALEKIRLVVNRFTNLPSLSRSDIERLVGIPVYATLPNRYAALSEACANGRLLPEGTDLRRQMASLAARIAGIETAKKPKRSVLRYLLGEGAQQPDVVPTEAL